MEQCKCHLSFQGCELLKPAAININFVLKSINTLGFIFFPLGIIRGTVSKQSSEERVKIDTLALSHALCVQECSSKGRFLAQLEWSWCTW